MTVPAHVVVIVQNLPVPFDRRVWLEATSLRRAGYAVTVIAPSDGSQLFRETVDGVNVRRYPRPREARTTAGYIWEFAFCWFWTAFRSFQVWRERRFDILHACNPPETYWALAALYRPFGVRFVFDHHDLSPEMYLAKGGREGGLLHRALRWLERRTLRAADLVLATNDSHAEIAEVRGGVPRPRIHVVRSGPDTARLRVVEPDPAARNGREYLVGYLGEMCEQDGVDHLLEAAREIVFTHRRTDVQFILVGGGPHTGTLRALSERLDVERFVTFTGRVSDEDLCRYLSTVDLCVDPDPLTEWSDQSTMNKIMEYMFFARPIVAYPLKENAFSAGDAAVFARANDPADLANQILALLADPRERERRGRLGLRRVREFLMWDRSEEALLRAYRQLATAPGATDA